MVRIVVLSGLAAAFASLVIMQVVLFLMIRAVNLDPGPQGRIPLNALIPRMARVPLNDYIQRYRAQKGDDWLYRMMQLNRLLFGVGFFGAVAIKLSALFLHK
jgi:hypothetical protein